MEIVPAERKDRARNAWTYSEAAEHSRRHLGAPQAVLRVSGPSGFGKSRFVYEALGSGIGIADEIDKASVIYTDGSVSGDEAVKLALELADAGHESILVVDECPDDLHQKLAQRVRRANSKMRLVTLDIETKVIKEKGTLLIRLERANDKLISDIAKGIDPSLNDGVSGFIAELSEGFPSMAVLAAEQGGHSRDTLASAEQVLDRVIWGGRAQNAEAQKALEAASLFDWIGIQGRVEGQASFVATEVVGIALPAFVEHLFSFKSRGIVSIRGDFVQVGPVPLAARLGIHRLSVISHTHLLQLFEKAPEGLAGGLLRRLKWLDTAPTAVSFAKCLLEPTRFGNLASMNTEAGARLVDYLVHVAPDAVSSAIERVLGELSIDELQALHDGRRHLVWALDKLVFRKETFERSARLLLKLAAAENEMWANNATGEFTRLYQLYLSGTEAGPAVRLRVLDDGRKRPVRAATMSS